MNKLKTVLLLLITLCLPLNAFAFEKQGLNGRVVYTLQEGFEYKMTCEANGLPSCSDLIADKNIELQSRYGDGSFEVNKCNLFQVNNTPYEMPNFALPKNWKKKGLTVVFECLNGSCKVVGVQGSLSPVKGVEIKESYNF